MKTTTITLISGLLLILMMATTACGPKSGTAVKDTQPRKHEHHPPHGGTPVVLGDEIYHLELVRDEAAGRLQAFVLDGEMENFIRSSAPSFEVVATVGGVPKTLVFRAVSNPATGETVGDSSLFESQADWLKSTPQFDAELKTLTVRGTTFTDVRFNFPKGNDDDA
jgi:hypothetical protein